MRTKNLSNKQILDRKVILQKAIEKAVENGLDVGTGGAMHAQEIAEHIIEHEGIEKFIFSHDFAKAFWGEKEVVTVGNVGGVYGQDIDVIELPWRTHLQQLALAEDRLEYISKYIE